MIRMMEWTILSQQARLSLLPGSLVSTLTLIPQQSPLLLSMACFVLQQNFHHTGPLPLFRRHGVCVGEESASQADTLPVSLEAPEDVDPSHRGIAPPLGESAEAVDAKSSGPPTLCKGVPSSALGRNASDSEVDVTFLGTEAFVVHVGCFCRSHCSSKEAVKVEVMPRSQQLLPTTLSLYGFAVPSAL